MISLISGDKAFDEIKTSIYDFLKKETQKTKTIKKSTILFKEFTEKAAHVIFNH